MMKWLKWMLWTYKFAWDLSFKVGFTQIDYIAMASSYLLTASYILTTNLAVERQATYITGNADNW